jgi:hypothetical protein
VSAARKQQADRIVATIERWLSASPGERSISLRETLDGWEAVMTESRKCGGKDAIDALAQISVVASVENEEAGT